MTSGRSAKRMAVSAPSDVAGSLLRIGPVPGAPALRDYQARAEGDVLRAFANGHRRVLLHAPTGAGKTVMFASLAARFHGAGFGVLVVAHRRELLTQAAGKLAAAGIGRVAIYRGARDRKALAGAACVVASVQTRDLDVLRRALAPGLVIVDEAHHVLAASYARLLDLFPGALHVGATATPWWGKGKGLGAYFEAIVTAATVAELTAAGHLARARIFTHPNTLRDLDLRGVATSHGDYVTASLAERVDRPALLGDMVAHWQSHGRGDRTLCFAASVEHSQHIVARFRAAGIAAEHLDGTTPDDVRRAMLARLVSGETRLVSNYGVLTEGFDAPAVGCVILARPTKRLGVYVQTIGRGLRVDGAKDNVVVLDHAGLCLAFGFPEDDRPATLDGLGEDEDGQGGGLAPVRRCPACGLMVPLAVRECPECLEALRRAVPGEDPAGVLVESLRGAVEEVRRLTLNGRTQTIPEWAKELGILEGTIRDRLRRGLSDADALAPVSEMTLTLNGRTQTIPEWAKELGISTATIYKRLKKGWSDAEALASASERTLTLNGRTQTIPEWAKELGISTDTIYNRLCRGLSDADALAPASEMTLTLNGRTQTIPEWAKELGISTATIYKRLKKGWSDAEALTSPKGQCR